MNTLSPRLLWTPPPPKRLSDTPLSSLVRVSPSTSSCSSTPLILIFSSSTLWLALYFIFNLSLTLYNKSVLLSFPFPYTLTAIHALFGSVGLHLLKHRTIFFHRPLREHERWRVLWFSALYTVNILVSNVSLQMVTVPFHQVVRASAPFFTILLSASFLGPKHQSSKAKLISLIPVVLGVGLATYGDYYFTPTGFLLTLLGTFLASLKTIFTYILQSPSQVTHSSLEQSPLHPLSLLTHLSPLAFIHCVLIAHFSGELALVSQYSASFSYPSSCSHLNSTHPPSHPKLFSGHIPLSKLGVLVVNGGLAFGLNVVSFIANGKVGAVGMGVAANIKQVLTILFAVSLFDLTITKMNLIGIGLTVLGGFGYVCVGIKEGTAAKKERV